MMVGNKEVYFQYSYLWSSPETREGQLVTCIIKCGPAGYSGIAKCGKSDNFNKAIGRKIAFTRALKNIPRAERKELWEAYKQSHKYLTKRS